MDNRTKLSLVLSLSITILINIMVSILEKQIPSINSVIITFNVLFIGYYIFVGKEETNDWIYY